MQNSIRFNFIVIVFPTFAKWSAARDRFALRLTFFHSTKSTVNVPLTIDPHLPGKLQVFFLNFSCVLICECLLLKSSFICSLPTPTSRARGHVGVRYLTQEWIKMLLCVFRSCLFVWRVKRTKIIEKYKNLVSFHLKFIDKRFCRRHILKKCTCTEQETQMHHEARKRCVAVQISKGPWYSSIYCHIRGIEYFSCNAFARGIHALQFHIKIFSVGLILYSQWAK